MIARRFSRPRNSAVQRPDPDKRRQIMDAATRLFATRPFHEVLLDEVAAAAEVGKGTLYIYFKSKEDLYLRLIREGFEEMVGGAERDAGEGSGRSWDRLRRVVAGLVGFAGRYPDLYRVMRSGQMTPDDPEIQQTRQRLTKLVESILRDGIRDGEMADDHPEITAQFVLGFVRGAMLYPPAGMTGDILERHVVAILRSGIGSPAPGGQP
jgi:AcrR family transcriptional regulator